MRAVVALVAVLAATGCSAVASDTTDDVATIGILRSVADPDFAVFVEELEAQGWRDGENVHIVPTDPEEIHASAEEARLALESLLDEGVALVVAFSTPHAQLLVDIAPRTPGLFLVNDPVAAGLVVDERRPAGQLTGLSFRTPADRTLDLATRTVGGEARVGYLWPGDDTAVPGHRSAVMKAAERLGIDVVEASFDTPGEVDAAVGTLVEAGVDVVLLASANATIRALAEIEEALDRHGLPAVANTDLAEFAVVVLTPDRVEVRRQLARQAARLLRGSPVASIPVEDPRRFVLVVNRTQADRLGVPLEPSLLRQADLVR